MAEDWVNVYNAVSQINFNNFKQNIIIHIYDACAHSKFLFNYELHNEQYNLLKEALLKCSDKNFKITTFFIIIFEEIFY